MRKAIISLIALLGLLLFVSACTKDNNDTAKIIVDKGHMFCEIDEDCASVLTQCSQCECYGQTVNKQYEEQYIEEYKETCKSYTGPSCDVICAPSQLKCVDNTCSFVEDAVTEDMIDVCEDDNECVIVTYNDCCGSSKKAINQKYLSNYYSNPDWQKFDDPEI